MNFLKLKMKPIKEYIPISIKDYLRNQENLCTININLNTNNLHSQLLRVEQGTLNEVTGESGTGKSNLLITLSLKFALILNNNENVKAIKILYINTNKTFPENRLIKIIESNIENSNKRIFIRNLITVKNLFSVIEYESFIHNIEEEICLNNYKVIMIDSFTFLADKITDLNYSTENIPENNQEYKDINDNAYEENFIKRKNFIKNQIKYLKLIVQKYNLYFYVTNNVSSIFHNKNNNRFGYTIYDKFNSKSKLGENWNLKLSSKLFLSKTINDNNNRKYYCELLFSDFQSKFYKEFEINDKGLLFID